MTVALVYFLLMYFVGLICSMENLVVTLSNVYGVRALAAWPRGSTGQLLTASAMAASMLYHAVEQRKHSMPALLGSGSLLQHRVCINLDRAAALGLGLFLCAQPQSRRLALQGAAALAVCAASELFHWLPQLKGRLHIKGPAERQWYVAAHSLWHLAAFHLVYLVAVQ